MDQARIRRLGQKCVILLSITILSIACKKEVEQPIQTVEVIQPEEVYEFGFNLNDYFVKRDTIRKGDSFGEILQRNQIDYSKIFQIAQLTKDSFDIISGK